MERKEAIDTFIASVTAVNRDLQLWKKEGLPSDETVKNRWNYFSQLLQIVKEEEIDKNLIVIEHAQNCMKDFIEIAPDIALGS